MQGTRPQLITYPDSLGGDLRRLSELLDGPLAGCFGGVHLLPPFPSSGDRGFAPIDQLRIDPRFGTWADVERVASARELCLDLIVNHVSRRSEAFADFERHGRASEQAELFLPIDKIWPGGVARDEDLARIFRRRASPFSDYVVGDPPTVERLWTTFGSDDPSEQVDIDARSPRGRRYLAGVLDAFGSHGVRMVRLDAVGYVIKRAGTSCFMVQPELDELLGWLTSVAQPLGIRLLTEVHGDVATQRQLAGGSGLAYDFAFPGVVLHAVMSGETDALLAHLRSSPRGMVTTLDSHDGIPIQPDLDGALPLDAARAIVEACLARGGNVSRVLATASLPDASFDAHQANAAVHALLGGEDAAHLVARAIQLFAPGLPQVYYVGLLAGGNDPAGVAATGDGRVVNRHDFAPAEVTDALARPVVAATLELLRLRTAHPAFDGEVAIAGGDGTIELAWTSGPHRCALRADLRRRRFEIDATPAPAVRPLSDR